MKITIQIAGPKPMSEEGKRIVSLWNDALSATISYLESDRPNDAECAVVFEFAMIAASGFYAPCIAESGGFGDVVAKFTNLLSHNVDYYKSAKAGPQ